MNKQELTVEQSAALEEARQLFASWRKSKTGRPRIPDSLWKAAANLHYTQEMTINTIARSLRLNHTTLKENIGDSTQCAAIDPSVNNETPMFIEVAPQPELSDCVIEIENQTGLKMRMCFRGRTDPAVISLGKSLFADAT